MKGLAICKTCGTDHSDNGGKCRGLFGIKQEPTWSGEGLPPVGTKCEVQTSSNSPWFECEIVYSGENGAAFISTKGNSIGCVDNSCTDFFRPIRSPDEVARDEAIKAMREALGHAAGLIEVSNIYRAIAAGKIPGVKLE